MRLLIYISIALLLSNCNNRKEVAPDTIIKIEDRNYYIHKNDTNTSKKQQQKNSNINDTNKDSIFFVKGLSFEVNGIKCYWEFKINKVGQVDKYGNNILILNEILRIVSSDKILFETANEVENSNNLHNIKTIDYLKTHSTYDLECEDIDLDGYCDFKILIERAAAGANETYEVYLFNPKNKKFEHSEIFSGTNIEYDSEKNRISTMWKMGGGIYAYGYLNLKKNKKAVDFFEEIYQNQDTIRYTKSIGKKIIKRKRIIMKSFETQEDYQYLLERNKK